MLRFHFLPEWYALSDSNMEDKLYLIPIYSIFADLDHVANAIPSETTILRFRHLPEKHYLAQQFLETINVLVEACGLLIRRGTAEDAIIISAPNWTSNRREKRDPAIHHTKKGDHWHFGMKAYISIDVFTGLVHNVVGTAANVHV